MVGTSAVVGAAVVGAWVAWVWVVAGGAVVDWIGTEVVGAVEAVGTVGATVVGRPVVCVVRVVVRDAEVWGAVVNMVTVGTDWESEPRAVQV